MPMDFVPLQDETLVTWMEQFISRLPGYASTLGLTAADLTSAQADSEMTKYLVNVGLPAAKTAAGTFAAYKESIVKGKPGGGAVPSFPTLAAPPTVVPPGVVKRLRALVKRIKAAPGYTEVIGRDLKIIAPAQSSQPATTPKPTFRPKSLPGSVIRLTWVKGKFNGVIVECRRGGGNWEEIGRDNYSPFDDNRAPLTAGQPEVREYRLRYFTKDQPVGDYSDTVSSTTMP